MTQEQFLKEVEEKLNATIQNVVEANAELEQLKKEFPNILLEEEEEETEETPADKKD